MNDNINTWLPVNLLDINKELLLNYKTPKALQICELDRYQETPKAGQFQSPGKFTRTSFFLIPGHGKEPVSMCQMEDTFIFVAHFLLAIQKRYSYFYFRPLIFFFGYQAAIYCAAHRVAL